MARRSSRIAGAVKATTYVADNNEEDTEASIPRQRKKPRTAHAATGLGEIEPKRDSKRTRRGILEGGKEAPLDVLLEIFQYLTPFDLLRLSRTSKDLRRILTSRSTAFVWKAARENVEDLLNPPPDMNEIQYANLLFSPHCHICSAPNPQTILWEFRIRACKKCMDSDAFVTHKKLISSQAPSAVLDALSCYKGHNHRYSQHYHDSQYYRPLVDRLVVEYAQAMSKGITDNAWTGTQRQIMDTYKAGTANMKRWLCHQESKREEERLKTRNARKESIILKLVDLGWETELKIARDDGRFSSHKAVTACHLLTDRAWFSIKPQLVELMERVRTEQLIQERAKAVNSIVTAARHRYLTSQPHGTVVPLEPDIVSSSPFRTILDKTPVDVTVTTEMFEPAIAQLPQIIQDWCATVEDQLLSILPGSPGASSLSLATTWFSCKKCSEPIGYPRALVHSCFTYRERDPSDKKRKSSRKDLAEYEFFLFCEASMHAAWNINYVCWDKALASLARTIVRNCQLDPDAATIADMDVFVLECAACTRRGRVVMRWTRALSHPGRHSTDLLPAILTSDELDIVKREEIRSDIISSSSSALVCKHCHVRIDSRGRGFNLFGEHLRTEHKIARDHTSTEDWTVPLDSPWQVTAPRQVQLSINV